MAIITPSTDLILLKCPLEVDQQNQITFNNYDEQAAWFQSLPKREVTDFTYQRKDGTVRFPAVFEDIRNYNYCMYKNTAYANKWFYCFIEEMEYVNDTVTQIKLRTDVWQTWQLSLTYKPSFIEREHVDDDSFGWHTIPEGLETGDYVCNDQPIKYIYAKPDDNSTVILFQVSKVALKNITFPSARLGVHNGIPQGCYCFGIRMNSGTMGRLHNICGHYDADGAGEAIIAISLVPYDVIGWDTGSDSQGNDDYLVPKDTWGATQNIIAPIYRNATLDGYVPKNNKLFTSEFSYLYVSNNAGGDITYAWENFKGGIAYFAVASALEQGGSVKIYPQNSLKSSNGIGDGWTEGLQGPKLPAISWISDYYLNWQAVNGTNTEIQAGLAAANFGVNALTAMSNGSPTGGVNASLGFAQNVAGIMQKVKEAQLTPPQAKGNVSTGDVNFSNRECGFTFRKMSVRYEMARIIDEYFSMFGYKVHRVKDIQINTRRYWNYIRCIQPNILGDIPQEDMNEIKSMFTNGITFWHDPSKYLDYTQDNAIV